MSNSIIDTIILFFATKFRFIFKISFSRFKGLFKYSWKLFLASIVSTIYDEAKPLIVGIKFTTADLAFYNKGSSFPNLINSTISNTMSGVLFPALSKLQDDKGALLAATRRYIKVSSFVIFPFMIGLLVVANTFVDVVLTDKWIEIVPFMRIFCVCYMFDLVQVGNLQVFKAMGRTDISLITEIIKKSVYFVIIVVFVLFSDNAVIFALANIMCTIVATVVNTYPNRKLLGYKYRYQLKDIANNLLTAILMGVCVYFVGYIPINTVALLVLQVIVGIFVYTAIAAITKNENLTYIIALAKDLFGRRKQKMPNILKKILGKICRTLFTCLPPKNYIIFESVPDLSDSTKPVFDEMIKRGLNKKYKLIWWVKDKNDGKLPQIDNVIYVDNNTTLHLCQFQYYLFRAKCFIYCNRHFRKDNQKTKVFYITHGTAIKSIKSYYSAPKDLDYCFITAPHFISMMSEQNSVPPEKIVAFGYPRNDALSEPSRGLEDILQKDYDKVIVWYPTFRQHKSSKKRLSGDSLPIIHDAQKAKKINDILVKNRVLVVLKPHFAQDISYVKDLGLSNIVFIDDNFFVEHNISSYQFVGSCDALLTDYSSIYFDYLLCDKPIGLVWEDIDSYRENPGFAIDLDYYMKAGEKIYSVDDLSRFIENVANGKDSLKSEREEINSIANYSTDGKNTERVVDFIIDKAGL